MSIKLVVFDLDDTIIINTIPFSQIRERIFRKIGIESGPKHLYEFLRDMGDEYVKLLEEEEIRRAKHSRVHPSLPKVLALLKNKRIRVAVLTRNSKHATMMALGEYANYFDDIITRDDPFEPKPSPEAILYLLSKYRVRGEECLVVGDYDYDIIAGKKAGCMTVRIGDGDGDYRIVDLAEIIPLIENFP